MARRFDRNMKRKKRSIRAMKFKARKNRKFYSNVLYAKEHVFNLTKSKLTDNEYLLLAKGMKFIPTPSTKVAKNDLLKDFDELARKMRCKFNFQMKCDEIHPFYTKSGYEPPKMIGALETYIDKTKLELSSIQIKKCSHNLSQLERRALNQLRYRNDIVIKKADKNNICVVMNKRDYIKEGDRQLNTKYYEIIDDVDLSLLQRNIENKINELKANGYVDKATYRFLMDITYPRLGRLYLLPKLHKLDQTMFDLIKEQGHCNQEIICPARPIISQCGSVTERISQYVDHFLIPIVKTQSTYIRDSSDFIVKIEKLRPHAECIMVSYDVTSLYTNMQFKELLTAVSKAYSEFNKGEFKIPSPPTEDLLWLLQTILENNVFEFNSKKYKQIIGCAMGSKCSPEVCDIRMYEVTSEILNKFPFQQNIVYHGRYRDDGFIIYQGEMDEIHQFFQIANSYHPLLKFTYEISDKEMNFLDITLFKGERFELEGILDVKTFIKPTNTFQYLERNSAHSPSVFKGIIKGEIIRHLRNTSDCNIFYNAVEKFKVSLLKRGYNENEIDSSMNDVLKNYKRDHLNKKKEK
jgi:hypothetical protein